MKRPDFWTEIKSFCKTEQIQIMAIIETKAEQCPKESTWRRVGFDHIFWAPSVGLAGGICVLWKAFQFYHISIEPIKIDKRFMSFRYLNPKIKACCARIFVYAPPYEKDKDPFWKNIKNHMDDINIPCIVLGDLNEIQNLEEKNGRPNTESE